MAAFKEIISKSDLQVIDILEMMAKALSVHIAAHRGLRRIDPVKGCSAICSFKETADAHFVILGSAVRGLLASHPQVLHQNQDPHEEQYGSSHHFGL